MQKQKKSHFLALGMIVVVVFVIFSSSLFAQTWREPATESPSADVNASNAPDLIRINNKVCNGTSTRCESDADCTGVSCVALPQVKEGGLRVGSNQTSGFVSSLEVAGDVKVTDTSNNAHVLIQNPNLPDACSDTRCAALNSGAADVRHPLFTLQGLGVYCGSDCGELNSVGFGTNQLYPTNDDTTGKLYIYARPGQFPNGALYGVSTASHGVIGKSTKLTRSGIYAIADTPNSWAIFGKAIDVNNRGVYASSTAVGVPAAIFRGSVVVEGGFLQGDASLLTRVASINDGSQAITESGQAIAVWAKTVSIPANTTSQIVLDGLEANEVVRNMLVYGRTGANPYTRVPSSLPLIVQYDPNTLTVSIQNTSGVAYDAMVVAHFQTGIAISLTDASNIPLPSQKAILYSTENYNAGDPTAPSRYYMLRAQVAVAGAQSFDWRLNNWPASGDLCERNPDGTPGACGQNISGKQEVFFRHVANYVGSPSTAQIEVNWAPASGDEITQIINLQPVDIQTDPYYVAEYNSTVTVAPTIASAQAPTSITYALAGGETGSVDVGTGVYTYPAGQQIDALDVEVTGTINAFVGASVVSKPFTIYLSPSIDLAITYPDGPQVGEDALGVSATAGKNVTLHAAVIGKATSDNFACTAANCYGWAGADIPLAGSTLGIGRHTFSFAWTPPVGFKNYPAGFTNTKSQDLHVTQLDSGNIPASNPNYTVAYNSAGGVAIPMRVQVGDLANTPQSVYQIDARLYVNETSFVPDPDEYFRAVACSGQPEYCSDNQHISCTKPQAIIAVAHGTGADANLSTLTFRWNSCNSGQPYSIRVRNPIDWREWQDLTVQVTGCPINNCQCSSCPYPYKCEPCCNTNTETDLPSQPVT